MDVALVMGSISDWDKVRVTTELLKKLNVSFDKHVISAHRMPNELQKFASSAKSEHYKMIIAAAGGAAHLPGMMAANTDLPVIGIPIQTKSLNGIDSLLSMVQMPAGVPVATVAIGNAGAKNAAILAAQIIALNNPTVADKLDTFRRNQTKEAINSNERLE
ncbi:5-(carboxyamino)imidazole ribonucleotide mutase [Apilactobacillus micheneri]|uniref:N5-carboxyaminoimidazole ribonucleotide mutase n=1 Tax=Apilactobacillus micheneri TaxID=1899430 RepID=A0ABY2YXV1_9LACO|nr:5-(carboxyamino)imidazole ribonucleotide mutase [Apilactobacillus micheneri]TPR25585.1 5-(carboxyamino)imidazole ribonucleotide mutase [Apilactobacillus micheneri]TPR26689.1 5-(carboxyamino)imidazole ribonucleotide mutase [Apilactobacillus micheneri]TPR28476.1 5-(carboxyamino)imidazole ribonucleotide mutase [Apilactobacillus micheneri]TPR29163.1 5-(carboxyamino)imidazole ribonucleotide mutase [Apilactobacillus micheneri]TPR30752.1 5-(carboxyamino)imidazole ribonucleotide mutase [Apilactobac